MISPGIDIKSGGIGINITRNQDTAVPFLARQINRRETALPCPLYHSGPAGIDMTLAQNCPKSQ